MNSDLFELVKKADQLLARLENWLPPTLKEPDWSASIAFRYRRLYHGHVLLPVRQVATIRLSDLVEVDTQKERLVTNTAHFVSGKPANHVLLTGARGTGKSSLIKACLNEFSAQGLRLIEVDKTDLADLPDIVEQLAVRPERFIIYCDDLSYEKGEPGYKELKSVLDGSVAQASDNLLIYATSNRRHLLPECLQDNLSYHTTEQGDIHPGEVVEEKMSLSERFGLWISFYPFSQDEYLSVVKHWLQYFNPDFEGLERPLVHQEALVWSLERGSRSGRVAFQFAKDFTARRVS
jgi:predicted AAA+ superfamily ATPase